MAPDQDWCLSCGQAAPGRLGGRPVMRAAATVAALTLALAGGAVAASYAALRNGDEPPATSVAQAPPAADVPPVTTPPAATTPPVATPPATPPAATPKTPKTTPPPPRPPPAGATPPRPAARAPPKAPKAPPPPGARRAPAPRLAQRGDQHAARLQPGAAGEQAHQEAGARPGADGPRGDRPRR